MKNLFFLLFILFLPACLFSFEMTLYWEVSHPEIPGFGYDAAGVGDVNNDGFADVLVSAKESGKGFLYFGGSPMDTVADLIFYQPHAYFPYYTTSGDFNGDSISDLAMQVWDSSLYVSAVTVYYGGTPPDTTLDFLIRNPLGDSYLNGFGLNVTSGGDLNGDGYDEIICSAQGPIRRSFLFWGGETIDTVNYLTFPYYGPFDMGDVNGDGFDDLIATSFSVTVIFFGSTDFDTIPDIVFDYPANRVYISDINGDGYGDALILNGPLYVYLGGEDMDTCYDAAFTTIRKIFSVNRDYYNDLMGNTWEALRVCLGSREMDTIPDWELMGFIPYVNFNNYCWDVNGDTINDMVFSCWPSYSKAWIYIGDPSYTEIDEPPAGELVNTLALFNNYPNPFNSSTVLRFHIPESKKGVKTKLTIYNILGEKVKTLLDKPLQGADYEIIWDGKDASGKDVPSGTYFAELRFGYVFKRIKLQLLK